MGDVDDLYAELGLTPRASPEEIAGAYQRLGVGVADAHDVLADRHRRAAYDSTRQARRDAAAAAATTTHVTETGTADTTLTLTFDQAAVGTTATVRVEANQPCPSCAGTGTSAVYTAACPDCEGSGLRARQSGGITIRHECRTCEGTGRQRPRPCGDCNGAGEVRAPRDVTLRVPGGVEDGTRLRFRDPHGGGDRFAVIRVEPHPYFSRRGRDLALELPLTIAEAALGTVVTVPTLEGAVAIRIPPGTPTGRTFRVANRGIAHPSGRGDLLVTASVIIPTTLNDDQRRALEAFAAATPPVRSHFESASTAAPRHN